MSISTSLPLPEPPAFVLSLPFVPVALALAYLCRDLLWWAVQQCEAPWLYHWYYKEKKGGTFLSLRPTCLKPGVRVFIVSFLVCGVDIFIFVFYELISFPWEATRNLCVGTPQN